MTAIEYYKKFGYAESKLLADNNSHSIVDAGDGKCFHINDLKKIISLLNRGMSITDIEQKILKEKGA